MCRYHVPRRNLAKDINWGDCSTSLVSQATRLHHSPKSDNKCQSQRVLRAWQSVRTIPDMLTIGFGYT